MPFFVMIVSPLKVRYFLEFDHGYLVLLAYFLEFHDQASCAVIAVTRLCDECFLGFMIFVFSKNTCVWEEETVAR
jgi:hypothetical protein